jgi:hypothetical protein
VSVNGETKIGPLDEAERSLIRDRLFTAGELLRTGQLEPDREIVDKVSATQLELFGKGTT